MDTFGEYFNDYYYLRSYNINIIIYMCIHYYKHKGRQ